MIIKDWKKDVFTIPNMLSLFRLALIPVYVIIYLNGDYYIAGSILAVSCLTDMIDGQIARRFNMISTVGKFLDPLADKLTQFTMVICLAIRHAILWLVVGLIFVKEILQLVAAIVQFRKGRMLKGALISGKICTTVLFISLILMVLVPELSSVVVQWIAFIDIAFLLIASAEYLFAYLRNDSKFETLDKN
jgi:cardiolipin synthase